MAPRKMLTKARRAKLRNELTEAVVEGRFALLPGQKIDTVLDGVAEGIKNDALPIELTLDGLLDHCENPQGGVPFWTPELEEDTGAAELERVGGEPDNSLQAAEDAFARRGVEPPKYTITGVTGTTVEEVPLLSGPVTIAEPYLSAVQAALAPPPVPPMPPPPGIAAAQVQTMPDVPVPTLEAAEPPPPVEIDISAVEDWFQAAQDWKIKIGEYTAALERAKEQIAALLDQEGGPDRSKVGMLDGKPVLRRTFITRKTFKKDALLKDHPEFVGKYDSSTSFYKTELL